MVASCCAWNCQERFVKGGIITFHSFPADEVRRKARIMSLRRKNFVPSEGSKICSKHFTEECFDRNKGRFRLKTNADPTAFDFPTHLMPKVVRRGLPKRLTFEDEGHDSSFNKTAICADDTIPCMTSTSFTTSPLVKKCRYIGDFTEEDMKSPSKAKMVLQLAKENSGKNAKMLKLLREKLRRLEKKVMSLKDLVLNLRKSSLISEGAEEILEVTVDVSHLNEM